MDDQEPLSPELVSHDYEVDIRGLLPANPIYDKAVTEEPKPILRIEIVKQQNIQKEQLRPVFKKESDDEGEEEQSFEQEQSPFDAHYKAFKSVYHRFDNRQLNRIGGFHYYSSCCIDRRLLRQYKEPLGSAQQMLKQLLNQELLQEQHGKNEVRFDSNFQSGNLFASFKKSPTQYDLVLQNDVNSRGNTQWFYFTVSNLPQNVEVTFNIVNLLKSDSLFNYGMQPVVMSEARTKKNGEGWLRMGKNVSYFRGAIRRQRSKRFYYTLSFKLVSKLPNDTLHVAHCYPYTTAKLRDYLSNLVKNTPKKGISVVRSVIGKSVGNNPIELLTITEPIDRKQDNRKIIVVMARQHPGETQGSYVCEGMMDFLTGKTKQAEFLRKNFILKVIPMVNPDGVIFGNYRSNLMGYDLNRKWDVYDKDQCFPEVTCIKQLITQLNKNQRVRAIIDLHGHSKKLNSFFYGNPCPQHPENVRGFPFACSRIDSRIAFEDCTFTIEQEKRKAARVYLSLSHHLINVYTFQSSFYGYTKDCKKYAFGIEEFKGLGTSLCLGLTSFLEYDLLVQQKITDKLANTQYAKYINELKENPNLILLGDRQESGSDSKPEQYENRAPQTLSKTVPNEEDASPCEDEQKRRNEPVPSSNPISRKGKRELKDMIRNTRQLKVMEISRVNSILPDKYQLALQPAPAIPSMPYVPESLDRKRTTMRQSLRDLKVNTQTQTTPMDESKWDQLKPIEIQEQVTKATFESRPVSSKFKDNYDIKYISLASNRNKKNNILKLDVLSTRPLEPIYASSGVLAKVMRSRHSQTILSFPCMSQNSRFRSITHFPSVDSALERADAQPRLRGVQILRQSRLNSKRDNQDFLNEMVRKYLVNIKDRNKVRPIVSQEERIFYEKSSPPRADELGQERPLSIKKKQIFTQKKMSGKQRS